MWKLFNFADSGHVTFVIRHALHKSATPRVISSFWHLFPISPWWIRMLMQLAGGPVFCIVITGRVNDVNNSSVIYRNSSKVYFASPVKLWKNGHVTFVLSIWSTTMLEIGIILFQSFVLALNSVTPSSSFFHGCGPAWRHWMFLLTPSHSPLPSPSNCDFVVQRTRRYVVERAFFRCCDSRMEYRLPIKLIFLRLKSSF